MSSRCRSEALAVALLVLLAGCERENREYHEAPSRAPAPTPRLSTLQPGQPLVDPVDPIGRHYETNAYHVGQGGRLYRQFNCNGCHAMGGGAMGPALMDEQWRYGGRIDQIHATIMDGRPNGMPSWRGKITDMQAWQLAAYVRSLSGNLRKDVAPGRPDTIASPPPPNQRPEAEPRGSDPAPVQMPGQ